ncbi:Peroxidase 21 [Bienertia sinuspersici]
MFLDNISYKNILKHKGLLLVDQQLASDSSTLPYVENMVVDNTYFHEEFAQAMIIMSKNNPLISDQCKIQKDLYV